MAKRSRAVRADSTRAVEYCDHPEATGAQPYIKAQPPHGQYRFDSSLSPSLEWDEGNPAREEAEALIREILAAPDLKARRG